MRVRISTTEANSTFLLEPLDFKLGELKGLGIYLKSINRGYIQDGLAKVPFGDTDINVVYTKIVSLFKDIYDCELVSDDEADNVIKDAQDEADKFVLFSQKALHIRNNDIGAEELNNFTKVLSRTGFRRTLRPFQLLAAYHLAFSQNACNFSVPGSGKTTTVLAAYDYLRHSSDASKHVDKLLVVGPLAAFLAWKTEFKECYGREPVVFEIRGGVSRNKLEERLLRTDIKEDIIIASYGSLESKKGLLQHFLKNNEAMVVLDEAHRIKNVEEGVQSFAALSLSSHAKARVILTGTPAPNSYVDLYNLYKFIWPSHNVIGYSIPQLNVMGKVPNDYRVPDLIDRLKPFYIRVKKDDLGLPEATFHEPVQVTMGSVQQQIYDAIADMAVRSFEDSSISDIFKRSALIRLRQAATNPALLNKPLDDYYENLEGDYYKKGGLDDTVRVGNDILKLIRDYRSLETPAKFIIAKDLAESLIATGQKLLVWAEFISTCNDLSEFLTKAGIENRILYGATLPEEREQIITDFHDPSSSFKVVIANPHAVGESISLHKACHNALYLEQGYNAGSFMQSKDRIHRVGLNADDETHYHFLHSVGSLDSSVYERVGAKERRMLEIIEKEDIPLLAANADFLEDDEDDIKAIIREYYERREFTV